MTRMIIELHPDADIATLPSGVTMIRADIRRPGAVFDYQHMLRDPDKVYHVPMQVKSDVEGIEGTVIALHDEADVKTGDFVPGEITIMAQCRRKDPETGTDVVGSVPMRLRPIGEAS